jgi:predicted metalloprotease with PDZ domain
MNRVNIRRFEFDYDTTWNSFFLDEKLNIYSRYGGRDGGEPEDRLSKTSLIQTMQEVLAAHAKRAIPKKKNELPTTQPIDAGRLVPRDIPLLKQNQRGCIHCHQIREYQLLQWEKDKKFTREKLFNWPLPENIGMMFDRKHGHRIQKLLKDSAAAKAGMRVGDVVLGVNQIPIRSEYDVRWALGRVEKKKPITITVSRTQQIGASVRVVLVVRPADNWRDTPLGWRKSLRSVPLQFGFRGYSLTRSQRRDKKLKETQLAIRVVSVREIGLVKNLAIHRKDTIIALDGRSQIRTFEQFKSDIILKYKPGETVRLTVLREGKTIKLKGTFPNWSADESSVP